MLTATVETTGGLETFQWNISDTLAPANDYALEIQFANGDSPNYSNQISILSAGSTVPDGTATVTNVINHPSSTAPPSISVRTGTSSATPSSSSKSAGSGISGGAIAGIVIGVIGGLTLVLLATFWFLRQKRRARRGQMLPDGSGYPDEKKGRGRGLSEIDGGFEPARLELPGQEMVVPGRVETDGYELKPHKSYHVHEKDGYAVRQ